MNGTNRRAKGMAGQREAAAAWTAATGLPARNGGQSGMVGGMDMDQPAAVRIEVKRQETLAIPAWCRQAAKDAGHLPWVVLHRRSREPWRVTLNLDQLQAVTDAIREAQALQLFATGDDQELPT